jgi:hypothetical protein
MADKTNTSLANYFLNQLMNQQNYIGKEQYNLGTDTLKSSIGSINDLQDFFKNMLTGKDTGKLLDFVNPDEINKSYDTAVNTATELSPRGGLRTSTLGNLDFQKMGDIQKLIQGVREKAPDALTQLAGMLGNIGSSSINAGENAFGQNLQSVLAQLGFDQRDKDRRAELIGGIIAAAGSTAGAVACVVGDTIIVTENGEGFIANVTIGDKLLCRDSEFREVIDIRKTDGCLIYVITTEEGSKLKGTHSHILITEVGEKSIKELSIGDRLLTKYNRSEVIQSIEESPRRDSVYIIKLGDFVDNYAFVTNDLLSIDDDV